MMSAVEKPSASRENYLLAYGDNEIHLYPERSVHQSDLYEKIINNPCVIVHGPAGSGKSSLLQAAVIPRLKKENRKVFYSPLITNPAQTLKAILLNVEIDHLTPAQDQRPLIQLIADARTPGDLAPIFVIDQIEEFFEYNHKNIVSNFLNSVSRYIFPLADPDNPLAQFVFVVRSDYQNELEQLLQLKQALDRYPIQYVPHLKATEITTAINTILNQVGLSLTTELENVLISDIANLQPRTIDVQIILQTLIQFEISLQQQSTGSNLSPEITLEQYQSLGRAAGITRNFLSSEIQTISDGLINNGNRVRNQAAQNYKARSRFIRDRTVLNHGLRSILSSFITSRQVSLPVSRRELLYQVMSEHVGLNQLQIKRMIASLALHGLIVRIHSTEPTYQLANGAMAQSVWRWLAPLSNKVAFMDAVSSTNKILSNALFEHRMLSWDELTSIKEIAQIHGFKQTDLNLIYRSSLLNNKDSNFWHARMQTENLPTSPIISSLTNHPDFRIRLMAVKSLYKLGLSGIDFLCKMLDDEYAQIRAAATAALEKLDPSRSWHIYLTKDCFVPGGIFLVGRSQGGFSDEAPETSIELNGFYISKTAVTNQEFGVFTDDINIPFVYTPGMERHPATNVNWFEARDYARWASLRLPNEAEWEMAASWKIYENSNPQKFQYPWGNEFDELKCNMRAEEIQGTTYVGKYSPLGDSPYGCTDMAGNVWEWTSSLFRPYPYRIDDGRENASTPGSRVTRGGSHKSGSTYVTCTVRQPCDPYNKRDDVGFRCILNLPNTETW
jgi:hypothetical protein